MKILHVTSKDNSVIKRIRKSVGARRGSSDILIEGPKLIEESLDAGFHISHVVVSEESFVKWRMLMERCFHQGAMTITTSSILLSSISDVVTSQGVIALSKIPEFSVKELMKSFDGTLVVCDAIQDPGNVGAIVRSALAFGSPGIVLLPGSANPFGPKAVRGSAGACFNIPIYRMRYKEFIEFVHQNNIAVYILDAEGETLVSEADFGDNCAIIVGNEGSGVNRRLKDAFLNKVKIPVGDRSESLNAAVSISVVLFEISRRR